MFLHVQGVLQVPDQIVVIHSFGSSSTTFSVLCDVPSDSLTVSTSSLYSVSSITPMSVSGGTNFTVQLDFTNGVGTAPISFTASGQTATSKVIVAGFVLKDDAGNIVSGDGNDVTVGQTGSYSYTVEAVDTDGSSINVPSTSISFRSQKQPYMKEVNDALTKFSGDKFTLVLNEFRVGHGTFVVEFRTDAITYNGEVLETDLNVIQDTSSPPCVVISGTYNIEDGRVAFPMYNLLAPPRSTAVSEVKLSVGGQTATWDTAMSTLENPDQIVVVVAPATGDASLTCDGSPAKVVGGSVLKIAGSVSSPSSSEPLAKDLVQELKTKSGFSQFFAEIIVKNSSVAALSATDAKAILELFCVKCGADSCALTALIDGSAVCTFAGNVKPEDVPSVEETLKKSFDDCSFPKSLGYPCDGGPNDLALGELSAKVVAAGAVTPIGMSSWLVAVIACVGALALVSLMMVGLLAVYRRSAEQSESDYSSSGPLGVPDPSDLLYEQSIVRDIYGRGDFPDGGPTAENAADRERMANLREEVPRPPSSNSLSRASDVSSTYSV